VPLSWEAVVELCPRKGTYKLFTSRKRDLLKIGFKEDPARSYEKSCLTSQSPAKAGMRKGIRKMEPENILVSKSKAHNLSGIVYNHGAVLRYAEETTKSGWVIEILPIPFGKRHLFAEGRLPRKNNSRFISGTIRPDSKAASPGLNS